MIAVIDYEAGNAPSVVAALNHIGHEGTLTSSPTDIEQASSIILPGVGSAAATMDSLRSLGLIEPMLRRMKAGVPFLGICVGLQILFEHSEEGDVPCLGWFPGKVKRFTGEQRVPQIGWNSVTTKDHPLVAGLAQDSHFYFVNSYYALPEEDLIVGHAHYGTRFAAIVAKDNVHATQFHAEKSGPLGLQILRNFVKFR